MPEPRIQLTRLERTSAAHRRRRQRTLIAAGVVVAVAIVAGAIFAAARSGSPHRSTTGPGKAIRQEVPGTQAAPAKSATSAASAQVTASAPATPPATPTPRPAPAVVTIGWVGDTTPGSKYGNPPNSGRALFTQVRRYTRAPDLMVGNLEGTFGNGGPSKSDSSTGNSFSFQAPTANAAALTWAGFDVVNLANNHSNDYFAAGIRATKKALDRNDIAYTGLSATPTIKRANGVTVAFLGFSPYPWSPNIGDISRAKALVRAAARKADVVVVIMHAGAEGADKTHTPQGAEHAFGEFRGDVRAFSHAVVDAGADLVVGSGPHVVRGMERYQGKLIAYSLGNFAGWNNFGRSGNLALSGLLTVRITKDGTVLGGKWLPLRLTGPGVPAKDPSRASLALVRQRSKQDFDTPVKLAADGSFAFPAQ